MLKGPHSEAAYCLASAGETRPQVSELPYLLQNHQIHYETASMDGGNNVFHINIIRWTIQSS